MDGPRRGIIAFDDSRPRLLLIRFGLELDDADVTVLFERTLAVFRRRRRLVMVVDASNSRLSASQRKLMVANMRQHEEEFRRWIASSGLVVSSALARGTLTALMWMMSPPYEQRIFATLDGALEWSNGVVAELARNDRSERGTPT